MPSDRPLTPDEIQAMKQAPPKGRLRPPYKAVPPTPGPTLKTASTVSLRGLLKVLCDLITVIPEAGVYVAGYMIGNLVKAARLGYYDGRDR